MAGEKARHGLTSRSTSMPPNWGRPGTSATLDHARDVVSKRQALALDLDISKVEIATMKQALHKNVS